MCIVTYSWKSTDSIIKIEKFLESPKVKWAEIDIVEHCNFNCIWCYAEAPLTENKIMEFDTFKQIVDKLIEDEFIQVTLSGGEPSLHNKVEEFVRYAYKKGLIVHINSNGYNFTRDLVKKLKDCGLTQIQMNIESKDPQLHDFIRGKPGSNKNVIEAFKIASDYDVNAVALVVLSTYNIDELKDLLLFSREKDIPRFRVWDMVPKGKGEKLKKIQIKNYSDILNNLTLWALESGVKNIISYDPLFDYKGPLPTGVQILEVPCPHAKGLMMNIDVRGDVNICCTVRNVKLYNILKVHDIQATHKKINEKMFKSLLNTAPCRDCELFKKCGGGCIARYDEIKHDQQCLKYS